MVDQRIHSRIEGSTVVTVKVQSAPGIAALEGKTIDCQTADISFSGIRLQTTIFMPISSYLELSIVLAQDSQTYWHIGDVVWCKETDQKGQFQAGISLRNTTNSQADSWLSVIDRLLGEG